MPNPQNQQFWSKIAERPTEIQKQFWYGAEKLAKYLNDNPAMYKGYMAYDTSKPDPNLSWWEKILFYNGQAHYNEAVTHYNTSKVIADQGSWLWGMLKGDFNKDPSMSQIIVGGLISLIPIADQVCDVRDVIANLITLSDEKARTKDNYMALALTSVGIIPEIGSATKTIVKMSRAKDISKVKLFKFMEYFEEALTKLKIKCPWGKAPETWLRSRPWKGIATQAFNTLKNNIDRILSVINKCLIRFNGALKAALAKFQATLNHVLSTIKKYIDQLCDEVDKAIGRLLPQQPLAMAHAGGGGKNTPTGRYEVNVSSGKKTETSHRQKKETPPSTRKMPKHKPKCFKPGDALKKNPKWKNDPKGLEKEFERQLKGQEKGLNEMTADEFLTNLDAFDPKKSRSLSKSAQEQTRTKAFNDIRAKKLQELKDKGLSTREADQQSKAHAESVMKTMAALHNPDMSAGGGIQTTDIGDKGVNSSIGSQWSKEDRVKIMREQAKAAKKATGGNTQMNVELERCPK